MGISLEQAQQEYLVKGVGLLGRIRQMSGFVDFVDRYRPGS